MQARSPDQLSPIQVRGDRTVVRPATHADAARLVAWHADPEVSRYWDDDQLTNDEIVALLQSPTIDPYIVEVDQRPIGYLQAWFDDPSPGVCGLDMFLIPAARGVGLGPDAARALAEHLLASGQTRVTVDPYQWNAGAVRAWTRAGFREVERREPDDEHREPWVLMVYADERGRT